MTTLTREQIEIKVSHNTCLSLMHNCLNESLDHKEFDPEKMINPLCAVNVEDLEFSITQIGKPSIFLHGYNLKNLTSKMNKRYRFLLFKTYNFQRYFSIESMYRSLLVELKIFLSYKQTEDEFKKWRKIGFFSVIVEKRDVPLMLNHIESVKSELDFIREKYDI